MTFKLQTWDNRVEKDFILVNLLLSVFFMERDVMAIFSCLVADPFDNSPMSQYFTSLFLMMWSVVLGHFLSYLSICAQFSVPTDLKTYKLFTLIFFCIPNTEKSQETGAVTQSTAVIGRWATDICFRPVVLSWLLCYIWKEMVRGFGGSCRPEGTIDLLMCSCCSFKLAYLQTETPQDIWLSMENQDGFLKVTKLCARSAQGS